MPPRRGRWWTKDWERAGVLLSSSQQRAAVFARDHGICCDCGKDCSASGEWDAEHDVALHAIPPYKSEYPAVLEFWGLGNLKTRCRGVGGCHHAKTRHEAKNRAKWKRIKRKLALPARKKKSAHGINKKKQSFKRISRHILPFLRAPFVPRPPKQIETEGDESATMQTSTGIS